MIWLAWRQQRTETLTAGLLLCLVVALLLPTGLYMASVYADDGLAACLTNSSASCQSTVDSFVERWGSLRNLVGWLNLVPALLGVLIAAPFVLEFERGTFRLAWTQSVTRGRWLAMRIGLIVGVSVVAGALLALLMTWWRHPLDATGSRLADGFEFEGLVPSAYTLFAAALVVAIGVVVRRTAAAIGLSLIAFLVARIALAAWARPNYQDPIRESSSGDVGTTLRDAWVFSQRQELVVPDGQRPDPAALSSCLADVTKTAARAKSDCFDRYGIVQSTIVTYQPADRFWLFQVIETSIFVGMALVLLAFSVLWVRKRLS